MGAGRVEYARIGQLCEKVVRVLGAHGSVKNRDALFYFFQRICQLARFKLGVSQKQVAPPGKWMFFAVASPPQIERQSVPGNAPGGVAIQLRLPTQQRSDGRTIVIVEVDRHFRLLRRSR
jgi:hypothetical protein